MTPLALNPDTPGIGLIPPVMYVAGLRCTLSGDVRAAGNKYMRSMIMTAASMSRARSCLSRSGNTPLLARLRHPATLEWWEWGKIIGFVAFVWLAVYVVLGGIPSPTTVALVLHFAIDFTVQSPETAVRKIERGRYLLMHALIAGGLPLIVAGLVAGNPHRALIWMVIGAASHWAVDWTRRFGIRNPLLAALADQVCHLAVIAVLTI